MGTSIKNARVHAPEQAAAPLLDRGDEALVERGEVVSLTEAMPPSMAKSEMTSSHVASALGVPAATASDDVGKLGTVNGGENWPSAPVDRFMAAARVCDA